MVSLTLIKVIFIFVMIILVGIIRGYLENRVERENEQINKILSKINNHYLPPESIFIDEFVFSTYEGLFQNFHNGKEDENLTVRLHSDKLELVFRSKSIEIEFKNVNKINYSIESRGKYDAIKDKYITLTINDRTMHEILKSFDGDDIVKLIKYWRIRKNNKEVIGKSGVSFEQKLLETLNRYISN